MPEHRAAVLENVRGVHGRLYFQRQSLLELGPAAEQWLTELIHRRPTQWRHDVEQGFALLQQYGPARLLAACAVGLSAHAIGGEYLAAHVQQAFDAGAAGARPLGASQRGD